MKPNLGLLVLFLLSSIFGNSFAQCVTNVDLNTWSQKESTLAVN